MKKVYIKLSFKSRLELFMLKRKLKIGFSWKEELKNLFFPKKIGALFG